MKDVFIELLRAIAPDAVCEAKSRREAFSVALEEERQNVEEKYGSADLDVISFELVKHWSDRYDRAVESYKQSVLDAYLEDMKKKYPQLFGC